MTLAAVRELTRSAWQSLMVHRLRSLLSTLGIIFAVMSVVAMLAVAEGAKRETLEQIRQLGARSILIREPALTDAQRAIARERYSRGITPADLQALVRGVPGATLAVGASEIPAAISGYPERAAPRILAVTPAFDRLAGISLQAGRFISEMDIHDRNQVCVLGAEVAWRLGQAGRIHQTIHIAGRPFAVVGILQPRQVRSSRVSALVTRDFNAAVFIPFGAEPRDTEKEVRREGFSEVVLHLEPSARTDSAAQVARHILLRTHGGMEDFEIVLPIELLRQAQRTQRVFNLVLGSIAAISLLVGGIGIMNIMLASVTERTREIGICRAVGATRADIVRMFLAEACLLTATGGTLGLAAGAAAAWVIGAMAGWPIVLAPWSLLLALAIAVAVGMLSGLYPALKAASLSPVEALRHA